MKNIKMSDEVWKKLMKYKINFGYKTMDEVLVKIIEIIEKIKTANELIKQGGKQNDSD